MHLVQVAVWGAYKRPRELQWVVGVVLFILTLVLGLTGYLLPWDLNAYFASQVSLNITGAAPIAGPFLQNWLQGGPVMNTLTLNKFFGIHVWLTPLLLVLLVGVHLIIFRHNGSAGPPKDERRALKPGRFWPNQMFMDTMASLIVLLVIVLLAVISPAPLDAKADPNNDQFVPSPAWYFMGLYFLLEIFPGQMGQFIGTIVIPTLGVIFLILLPWLDRNPSREVRRRPAAMVVTAIFILIAAGLSIGGQSTVNAKAAARGQTAPTVPGGADAAKVAAAANAPLAPTGSAAGQPGVSGASAEGGTVFSNNCSACHGATGQGTPGAFPPLAGNSAVTAADPKEIIHIVLDGHTGPMNVSGTTYNGTMPPWKSQLKPDEIAAVLTYIRSSWGNHASAVSTAQVQAEAK
jgi:ubiquinol-cytochrome c reductase cytochrome b subunit